MDLVDVIIIILLVAMIVRGSEIGFIRQFFSTIGFVGGILIGAIITPHVLGHVSNLQARAIWSVVMIIGCGIILLSLGEYIGIILKIKLLHRRANKADAIFGGALAVITLLTTIWLTASVLIKLPYSNLQSEIQQSSIIGKLDSFLPPAPNVIAKIGHILAPNGFPQVFVGTEPAPTTTLNLPKTGSFAGAIDADAPSVDQVVGLGCGGIVEGSGFVASPGLVITNAHVVAGVARPVVIDQAGRHPATVIWFDPNLDLAVLRTTGLDGQPLTLNPATEANGTQGFVMGYPGGGPLSEVPAVILEEFLAEGKNIYNGGNVDRNIYELQAKVIPGNSGGPLISSNGNVIGIVFAQSTVYKNVGYALTMKQVITEFKEAKSQNQPVGSGSCAE